MDEIHKIRKAYNQEELTRNELSHRFNRSWNTVDTYVKMEPDKIKERGKRPNRRSRVVTKEVEDECIRLLNLEILKKVKRKQRYSAVFIYKHLIKTGIYKGSQRTIRTLVGSLRKELRTGDKVKSFIPLSFELGSTIQVDHGEFDCDIGGHREKGYIFVASVPGSAIRFCQAYPTKSQEAWGAFHEEMFRFFGGIFPEVIYDNDSVLVKKVLGHERLQTTFSHNLSVALSIRKSLL